MPFRMPLGPTRIALGGAFSDAAGGTSLVHQLTLPRFFTQLSACVYLQACGFPAYLSYQAAQVIWLIAGVIVAGVVLCV